MTTRGFAHPTPVGELTFEVLDTEAVTRHAELLHRWVTHPRSVYWQMQGQAVEQVAAAYTGVAADPHHDAWLGRRDGVPCFLAETYDPAQSELAGHGAGAAPREVGMHLLVAPPEGPRVPGLTRAVMDAVLALCFSDERCQRVVVEPDVRNEAIAVRNAEAGFVVERRIRLSGKEAALSTCTREAWTRARSVPAVEADDLVRHLAPAPMGTAQRLLVAKMIAELTHERLLAPRRTDDADIPDPADVPDGRPAAYLLDLDGGVRYGFTARRYPLEHWRVDADTVTRTVDGVVTPVDAQQLVIELRPLLGVPDALLGTYLEEVAATLAASAWKIAHPEGRRVAELVAAELPAVEAAMTEGHPGFVANSGRIGFGVSDHRAYAPEAAGDVRLVWLAAHRDHTHLASCEGVTERDLYASQLGDDVLGGFADRLRSQGLDPDDYLYLPVHPWQWEHKIAVTFAPDVAARRLVPLGVGPDAYRAQQSIRTFLDVDRPDRHYVKVALAIQNMGFLRGLSPAYMRVTPAINDHVAGIVGADPEFVACGFEVLREVASIGYTGDAYHRAGEVTGPAPAQRRMVAALWRESPVPRLGDGERAATMAALLHRDPDGAHLATAWIARSGVDTVTWLRAYLRVYLRPVAHALLAHDLAFMPHGENVILVLRDGLPVRAMLKDIGEEVVALHDRPLPPDVERIRMRTSPQVAALSVHTDVFDGVLRHLAGILDADGVLPAETFWDEVGRCLAGHALDHPEVHERVDLFVDRFDHSCLNRLQLRNTLQMVDLTDQASSLIMAGTLPNPVAGHRPAASGKRSGSAQPVPGEGVEERALFVGQV